ncbi:DUF5590 domain-containing protein [Paenibacillus montanisoli]|uniref:Cell wall elongation regulator TseB-like domain-containing protein n=1 Tax=Paenibacillus montanisoli TaxID=2081970 RepID=A0A328U0K5_9BACL|nr:DUF5590 domain-containing protein [Paenibacillus montanisoli]RAP76347.1 hypothetical protein DL346_13210 [Paenibacillus montanisoli]
MRANRRKRPPFMTPGRWIALSSAVIIVMLILLNWYYRSVQLPVWQEEAEVEAEAKDRASLSSVDSSYHYVWDDPVWVVKGKDNNGETTYVWLKENESITLRADEGIAKADMKAQFLSGKPDASIFHMKIGLLGGEPVWEVFYSRKQAGVTNFYYEFYRFRNGTFLITYKLPAR